MDKMKSFKECKWQLRPFMANNKAVAKKVLTNRMTFENPMAVDLIEDNWDHIMKPGNHAKLQYIANNPKAMQLIDKHWDWFKEHGHLHLSTIYEIPEAIWLIDKHWDWFIVYANKYTTQFYSNPKFGDFVERHWDWFTMHYIISDLWLILLNENAVALIDRHWDWFKNHLATSINIKALLRNKSIIPFLDTHIDWFKATIPQYYAHIINYCAYSTAIPLIEKHWDWFIEKGLIMWSNLCGNAAAIELLERHWDQYHTQYDIPFLLRNHKASALIEKHWTYIYTHEMFTATHLIRNPISIKLLEKHWDEISSKFAPKSYGSSCFMALLDKKGGTEFIDKHWDWYISTGRLFRYDICHSSCAVALIEKHWDWFMATTTHENPMMIWRYLCQNDNPQIVDIIGRHWTEFHNALLTDNQLMGQIRNVDIFDKHWDAFIAIGINPTMYFVELCKNKSDICAHDMAIFEKRLPDILKTKNKVFINNSIYLMRKSEIFVDEYRAVTTKWFRCAVTEELMATVWHPRNISRFPSLGVDPEE